MTSNNRRKRHRILALAAAAAMSIVVALGLLWFAISEFKTDRPAGVPPTQSAQPPSGQPPTSGKPRPDSQSADCPDVQMVSIPGTWESSPVDDPLNPTGFPNALLLNVSRPIVDQFGNAGNGGGRLQVYTVPYVAQFHNPFSRDTQVDYNISRKEGTDAAIKAITDMNNFCPLTSYVIVGFSQGAVIAGDIASDIGNGRGPVDEDLVLGVTLIADGRRQTGVGKDIAPTPPGQGAEITLHEVPILSSLGLTMSGPRMGGFGKLNDRVNEICAVGDLICAAPEEAFNIANLPTTLNVLAGGAGQPVHALYNTTEFWAHDGQPATVWTRNWASGVIDSAPRPKHG